jgi:phage tail-like protein
MATTSSPRFKDPLPVFCFWVQLGLGGDTAHTFFKSVGGLRFETEVVPVREGGTNGTTFQLPGATKWSNIVLKQGFTRDSAVMTWRQQWIQAATGQGGAMHRIKTGKIIQLDTSGAAQCSWTFYNGWPCKWEISEFDASKSELAIETLEIAHDGLEYNIESGQKAPGKL